jgi:Ca-activated chloride channel family protein
MRIVYIIIALFSPLLAVSQYYLKGMVKDENGHVLQHASIYLHSSGYVYYSGTEGTFGITTSRKRDSITVAHEGYQKQTLLVDAENFVDIKLKKAEAANTSRINRLSSLTQNLRRESQQQWFTGDETYASIVENQFISADNYPATGLSLNVDRASYSNIRRFLSLNTPVPPDAVRLEEMLNYFNFGYQEPADNNTFAFRTLFTECPWNKNNQLLFLTVNSRRILPANLSPSHLVFLVDISGSMDMPGRLPLLKAGFKSLVQNLRPQDSVTLVVYGGTVGLALPTTGGDEKTKIFRAIDSLQPGGSTPGESGIRLAYSVARNHFIKGGNNRIILATDGDFNVGLKTDEELEEMIIAQKESGIYLTCLGIGMGNYKDSKIQLLAQKGNGNFAYIDSYAEAEKVLMKEFTQTLYTVADNAYLDVQFDPALVKEYRLLGFDNKVGAIRDAEAVVEGGEIGSAYSALVAFELVPTEEGQKTISSEKEFQPLDLSLQYRLPATTQILKLKERPVIRYSAYAQAPAEYRFAASVILFGEMLRRSKFVKEMNWTQLQLLAQASADPDNFSQKEFLNLVSLAKTIYSKKRKRSGDE